MTIKEIFQEACAKLDQANIENSSLNAGLILEEVTAIKRLSLPLYYSQRLSNEQEKLIRDMLLRRATNEPLQYILGYTEFYGYRIEVSPAVLIPRPETEFLIEAISHQIKNPKRIIDIGTGSGAIAITLKKIFPNAEVVAVDISPEALKIAAANALLNGVKIRFFEADIYSEELGSFDLIVSNPPYISHAEYSELPYEVREFEPELALVGDEEGLYFYHKIIELSKKILNPDGSVFFEIGEKQAIDIVNIAHAFSYTNVEIIPDLVGKDRIVFIKN